MFGPRGPVDIVVNTDRPPDGRRQDLDGIKLAGQERRVGQVDQPAGGAVHRVSGTHDRQARDLAGAVPAFTAAVRSAAATCWGRAGLLTFSSARQTVSP